MDATTTTASPVSGPTLDASGNPAASAAAEQQTSATSPSVPSGGAAERSAFPEEPAASAPPDGASKGRPVAPSDAHVVVIQPDNEVNVGVNMAKCALLTCCI